MAGETAASRRFSWGIGAATAVALAAQIAYVYFAHFRQLVHSDAAAALLMAKSALETPALVPTRWYWGNGDVWLFGAPLAALPVAALGIGVHALRITDLAGFALELAVLYWIFRRLGGKPWVAALAASFAMLGISRLHLVFVYVELAYGWIATQQLLVVATLALLVGGSTARRRWIWPLVIAFLVAACNPVRFLVFVLAPVLAAALWPWRGSTLRSRVEGVWPIVAVWGAAFVLYKFGYPQWLTFSPEAGHNRFEVRSASGIAENVRLLAQGLSFLCGDPERMGWAVYPGVLFVLGAFGIVTVHAFSSRDRTPLRFVALAQVVQVGVLLVPLALGNLMLNPLSARYLIPSTLPMIGLAVLVATARWSPGWPRRLFDGWLVLGPVLGALSFFRMQGASLEAANAQWSNRAGHLAVADALAARGLRHGFASYWNASLVTLLSEGRTRTCPASVVEAGVFPYKWAVDSGCFDRKNLGERAYFLAAGEERERYVVATTAAFGPALERFEAGGFEVSVFETARVDWDWLELPLPADGAIHFPLVLSATHPSIRRGGVRREERSLVATGAPGNVVFGPYVNLPAGDYVVRWMGEGVDSPGDVAFDAFSNETGHLAQLQVPARELVGRDELARMTFGLRRSVHGVELRVHSGAGARVRLRELRIERR